MIKNNLFALFTSICTALSFAGELPVTAGLLVDLDAQKGLTLDDEKHVSQWENQAPVEVARFFKKQDQGRKKKGSGRPTLRKNIPQLNGLPALVFRQGELVNTDEDTFDKLTTGAGYTWVTILAVHEQRVGLKDVNSFFGNLANSGKHSKGTKYAGLWGNVQDDNTLWSGERNGLTFGRFDKNNTQLLGPQLKKGHFHLIAGRLQAGTGEVKSELFLKSTTQPVATALFPVNAKANPSKLVIGQERDAIQHPGKESFDGEIARFLIFERPLTDPELTSLFLQLAKTYGLK